MRCEYGHGREKTKTKTTCVRTVSPACTHTAALLLCIISAITLVCDKKDCVRSSQAQSQSTRKRDECVRAHYVCASIHSYQCFVKQFFFFFFFAFLGGGVKKKKNLLQNPFTLITANFYASSQWWIINERKVRCEGCIDLRI